MTLLAVKILIIKFIKCLILFLLGLYTGMEIYKRKRKHQGFKKDKTIRGFDYIEFEDDNGMTCSLQKSSSALEDKIWLGGHAKIKEFYPPPRETDESWFELEDLSPLKHRPQNEIHVFSRMHLTRKHVKKLLPHLEKFVETGEI